jgi:hypothetical protein
LPLAVNKHAAEFVAFALPSVARRSSVMAPTNRAR